MRALSLVWPLSLRAEASGDDAAALDASQREASERRDERRRRRSRRQSSSAWDADDGEDAPGTGPPGWEGTSGAGGGDGIPGVGAEATWAEDALAAVRDVDVAGTVPHGLWVVTVAGVSACGGRAALLVTRGRTSPFRGDGDGGGDGLWEAVASLGIGGARPHPLLVATDDEWSEVAELQRRGAELAVVGGSAVRGPVAAAVGFGSKAGVEATAAEAFAAAEATLDVSWATGEATVPSGPGASVGGGSAPAAGSRLVALSAGVPLPADRRPAHCCSVVVWPKLVRACEGAPGSRVVTRWAGPAVAASRGVPADLCGQLGGLVGAATAADAVVAEAHTEAMGRRVAVLQRMADAKRSRA